MTKRSRKDSPLQSVVQSRQEGVAATLEEIIAVLDGLDDSIESERSNSRDNTDQIVVIARRLGVIEARSVLKDFLKAKQVEHEAKREAERQQ